MNHTEYSHFITFCKRFVVRNSSNEQFTMIK